MPSLKDLRNRIASVKATRKITKAMQMVAAAKLRRAQEAAVAARPYSERMATVLANLVLGDGRPRRRAAASCRHRQGPDASSRRLHRRARPVRRLQSSIAQARPRACRPAARRRARRSRSSAVGKKGNDILKRLYGRYIIDHGRSARGAHAWPSLMPQAIAAEGAEALRRGRVRRLHDCSSPNSNR